MGGTTNQCTVPTPQPLNTLWQTRWNRKIRPSGYASALNQGLHSMASVVSRHMHMTARQVVDGLIDDWELVVGGLKGSALGIPGIFFMQLRDYACAL